MRLTEFFKKIDMTRLDELQYRYKSEGGGQMSVVAHKQFVWLFDFDDVDKVEQDIQNLTGATDEDDIRERPDILSGTFDGSTLWLDEKEMGLDPQVSSYIKKVAQFLGAHEVSHSQFIGGAEDERTYTYDMYQIGKGVPEVVMHGTNTGAMQDIMRFGLDPSRGTGNWEAGEYGNQPVGKFDLNFLTTRYGSALFHANRSASMKGEKPVILYLKIPDRNQIGPDYDVAVATGVSNELADVMGFTNSAQWNNLKDWQQEQKEMILAKSGEKIWKQTGVFSYRGRIPANHIVGIDANLSEDTEDPAEGMVHFDSLEEFAKAYEIYQNFGYYYEGMEDEIEDMEDEDEDEDLDEIVGGSQAGAGDDSTEYDEHVSQWAQSDIPHGFTHY